MAKQEIADYKTSRSLATVKASYVPALLCRAGLSSLRDSAQWHRVFGVIDKLRCGGGYIDVSAMCSYKFNDHLWDSIDV